MNKKAKGKGKGKTELVIKTVKDLKKIPVHPDAVFKTKKRCKQVCIKGEREWADMCVLPIRWDSSMMDDQ